jgi:hypothetical protein
MLRDQRRHLLDRLAAATRAIRALEAQNQDLVHQLQNAYTEIGELKFPVGRPPSPQSSNTPPTLDVEREDPLAEPQSLEKESEDRLEKLGCSAAEKEGSPKQNPTEVSLRQRVDGKHSRFTSP